MTRRRARRKPIDAAAERDAELLRPTMHWEEILRLTRDPELLRQAKQEAAQELEFRRLTKARLSPIGAPAELSQSEARAMTLLAFGKRPDLPRGEDYVRQLRPIWRGLLKKTK